jgi:flagellar M-ring protein FliF
MSEATAFPNDIFRFWREAAFGQRIGILAFGVVGIILLTVTASIALRPHYSTLYGGLAEKDTAAVVKQLQDQKIDYHLSSSGSAEVRMLLAEKGLPSGGQDGWELFDKTRIGLSDFGEKVSYQRALEGELARTICSLDAVETARVQVSLPEQRLFADSQVKPTASVVLTLRGGQQLQSGQVRSVVNVVSGAAGMAAEDVTVADSHGRLLSSPEGADGGASTQFEQRRAYERSLEQTLQTMLDGVVGPGASVVRASADLDFGRVDTERETYQPGTDGKGILMTDSKAMETYQGPVSGVAAAIGKPGVSSNTSATPAPTSKGSLGVQYQRSDGTT